MTTEIRQAPDITNWMKFAFVCDGEVADIMVFPPDAEVSTKLGLLAAKVTVVVSDQTPAPATVMARTLNV